MERERFIIHSDMNNFYAAVEEKFKPSLRKIPFAVCGDPEMRHSIVMSKNNLAKKAGVLTGISFNQARQIGEAVFMAWRRTFIEVTAKHDPYGKVTPLSIKWNGKPYDVDRITDIRQRAATKAGGGGLRYTCYILGRERFLFFDDLKWFVEEQVEQ